MNFCFVFIATGICNVFNDQTTVVILDTIFIGPSQNTTKTIPKATALLHSLKRTDFGILYQWTWCESTLNVYRDKYVKQHSVTSMIPYPERVYVRAYFCLCVCTVYEFPKRTQQCRNEHFKRWCRNMDAIHPSTAAFTANSVYRSAGEKTENMFHNWVNFHA